MTQEKEQIKSRPTETNRAQLWNVCWRRCRRMTGPTQSQLEVYPPTGTLPVREQVEIREIPGRISGIDAVMPDGQVKEHPVATEGELFSQGNAERLGAVAVEGCTALVRDMPNPGRTMEELCIQTIGNPSVCTDIIPYRGNQAMMEIPIVAQHIMVLIEEL